ncbi:MAG: hypothetical protein RLZZ401_2378 [Pseudomonadota bacterium]
MDSLPALDWQRPWYQPWGSTGQSVAQAVQQGQPLHQALNHAALQRAVTCPRFVAPSAMPDTLAYESFVASTWQCPTRASLHDFFNGLCWLQFPATKKRLNTWQSEQIERDGIAGQRGPLRDAITLLDESGALLCAPDALWQALCAKDWRALFIDLRPQWARARLLVFGHACLEKLVRPRKPLVSHVYRPPCAMHFDSVNDVQQLDHQLAQTLSPKWLATKPFAPLPLLGVPGWWPANEDPAFYRDATVFRPPAP